MIVMKKLNLDVCQLVDISGMVNLHQYSHEKKSIKLMKSLGGSINCVKGRTWVERNDIILDIKFFIDGGSNEIYFEDLLWVLNNAKSKRSSSLSTSFNGAFSIVSIDRQIKIS